MPLLAFRVLLTYHQSFNPGKTAKSILRHLFPFHLLLFLCWYVSHCTCNLSSFRSCSQRHFFYARKRHSRLPVPFLRASLVMALPDRPDIYPWLGLHLHTGLSDSPCWKRGFRHFQSLLVNGPSNPLQPNASIPLEPNVATAVM